MDALTAPAGSAQSQPSLARGFDRYLEKLVHAWCGVVATIGICLVPLFIILDWLTMPRELLDRFFWYRGLVTAALALQLLLLRRTRPGPLSFLHGYASALMVAGTISWMTVDAGGFDSTYYAGLNLVIVAVNLFLPWRAIHSALNGLLIIAVYVGANAFWGGPYHAAALWNHLYFLCSTVAIGVAISRVKHELIAKEFRLRAELVATNASLDRSREELQVARDALWGEMEVAQRIQTALLPQDRRLGGYQVAARMLPAAEVGGDYYDIIETEAGQRWVAIGDVSGHGVEAGLVMMMTQTSILTVVQEQPALGPAEVFRAVNRALMENISRLDATRYMTLNLVKVEPEALVVTGKHQDILVWRAAERRVEVVENDGAWVGVSRDVDGELNDQRIAMSQGDVALFFTDGVVEATSAGGMMYGEERLAAALARAVSLSPAQAIEALFAEVTAFQPRQDDDVTMMLVKRER